MNKDIEVKRWDRDKHPDPEYMRQVLRDEGFTGIHSFSDSPGAHYPDHQHDYVEVRWLVNGEVTFGVHGEKYTLKPGDRLDMPANTLHNAPMHPDEGATYICASK